jgi:sulfate adenylyltransferase
VVGAAGFSRCEPDLIAVSSPEYCPELRETMIKSIPPHGGKMVNCLAVGAELEALLVVAKFLPAVTVDERVLSDIEMIATGGFSPVEGFMGRGDFESVCHHMHLATGEVWTIPVVLPVSEEQAGQLKIGDDIRLEGADGTFHAVMHIADKFKHDKRLHTSKVYRTEDQAHPGVAAVHASGDVLLGGPIRVMNLPKHGDFQEYRLTPSQARKEFADRGWRRVVGFQTRNPIHRAHEYIIKCALEITDGLFLHPLMGATKSDDIPGDVRMKCYEVLIDGYFPRERVLIGINPASMRYAGPREAIFHALIRQNHGCTHFIVGRDHAGVGKYYGTYDAQLIFDEFDSGEILIEPLMFEHSFYCAKTGGMATSKTSNSSAEERIMLSGTKVREMLTRGEWPPPEFTRHEIAETLIKAMKS